MKKTLTKYDKMVNESKGEGNIGEGCMEKRSGRNLFLRGGKDLRKKSTGFKTGFTRVVRSNSTKWSECKGMCHEENRNVSAGFTTKTKN